MYPEKNGSGQSLYSGPYYSFREYCLQTFGEKLYKLSLDGGMSCPNRENGRGGCTFCSEGGSGEFAGNRLLTVTEQLNAAAADALLRRPGIRHYIAYFQAFSNTYAPVGYLSRQYGQALDYPTVSALSIATRPDCFSGEIYQLLSDCRRRKPVWVELGLQTAHERTASLIRRGYSFPVFEETVSKLHELDIPVIVHLILGLPGETKEDFLSTVSILNRYPIQGVKFHLLHLLRGTVLAEQMDPASLLTREEYVDWICSGIGALRPDLVIHRLTGDGPRDLLIGPLWSLHKKQVLNQIHHTLKVRGIRQGIYYKEAF